VLCPGVSGTGKTTLARLLQRHVPEITVLTDDRAVVTRGADGLALWGSPWPGAARIASGKSASLATIVFIRHGRFCAVRPVTAREAFRRIVNTLSMPLWEPARCGSALEIVDALVSRSRLVELTYPPTEAGARWVVEVVQRAEPLGGRDQRG